MYTVTKKQTRRSKDIPFYFEKYETSEEYKKYFYNKFIVTKKFLSSSLTYTDDKLSITRVVSWESKDAFLAFTSDSYCYDMMIYPNRMYDIEHEITSDIEITKD
jgi:hypothetical protein